MRCSDGQNDLVAGSGVLEYAKVNLWITSNTARDFDRKHWIGRDAESICPPHDDADVAALISEISEWSPDMARLIRWLRETGTRTGEALAIEREDIQPYGTWAELSRGVKHNRMGDRTRTIALGRAALMLTDLPKSGRLFAGLHINSSVVSTRYGQWCRQRQDREVRAAEAEVRSAATILRFRLHDLRHAFALASILDDQDCIYRLQQHLGHSVIVTTEAYLRFLAGQKEKRQRGRRPDLFGSLSSVPVTAVRAA